MKQDREVANLLRDLMRGDGDRHADAKRHRGHDRCGDGRAIDEVVERVADDDGEHAAVVDFTVVRMTVAPQHQLLEQEEQEDADEQRAEHA